MVSVHVHGPVWFFGVDASLEAFATIIALCVAIASFKAYRMTREKKYAYFTVSFALVTLSFLARAVTDALLEEVVMKVPGAVANNLFYLGYVLHILLALVAYVLLIIITHKISDKRVIALLFLTLVPSLLLSGSYYLSFYGLSTIFLAFVALAYYQNYHKVRTAASCLVCIAFALLTISQILFLLEAVKEYVHVMMQYWYVMAHVIQAAGYLVLLIALIKTLIK